MKTIRLLYPQWQGAEISRWIPEIKDTKDSARGYYLGSLLLDFLSPSKDDTYTVPVSLDADNRKIIDGVYDRDVIVEQTKSALSIIEKANPDRIVTFGGECSVSVVPFTYLNKKYCGDVAMLWIDAHPDISLPGDPYAGYHAMAVTACMKKGDEKIVSLLPSSIEPEKILYVGLRDWEREDIKKRHEEYGISYITPKDYRKKKGIISSWIKTTGSSKLLIHFDMDVLDPEEIIAAVGTVPGGLLLSEVIDAINEGSDAAELVGLTIAEPMPRTAIRLKRMMEKLPLVGTQSN